VARIARQACGRSGPCHRRRPELRDDRRRALAAPPRGRADRMARGKRARPSAPGREP
jgi:hypothetical protein